MRNYSQLTEKQRYQIYEDLTQGISQTDIAQKIGVNKSTISRELERNSGLRGYRPRQAQQLSESRKANCSNTRITCHHWERVEQLIREDWSPEQVSEWLQKNEGIRVSHEWIYLYIYLDMQDDGDLYKHLRCQKKRRKRYGSYSRRGQLKNRVSIDDRPSVVDLKNRIGDWEADTVAGKQTGPRLVTLVERKSRFTLVGLAQDKSSESVTNTINHMLKGYHDQVKTITYDNGKEFAGHVEIAQKSNSKAYFAHPYSSWERGLNENTNGLLRQYFPKGSDFTNLTDEEVSIAMEKLNNRPRKCLGFKTPNQVFLGINPPVALAS
jgi:IS30 family transposase